MRTLSLLSVHQAIAVAVKEWRLLLRNPHGLGVLFVMPAIFVLVMSFTLKNTLTAKIELPLTGWVQEDTGPFADSGYTNGNLGMLVLFSGRGLNCKTP